MPRTRFLQRRYRFGLGELQVQSFHIGSESVGAESELLLPGSPPAC
jgi:hypothetical protein